MTQTKSDSFDPDSPGDPAQLQRCLAQFTECTITINIILKPSEVFFPPFLVLLLLLVLVVRNFDCFFECSLLGVLIQGLLLGGNRMSLSSSLLLSLLLGATDVDGMLEFEKYDLISILKLGKSWLN